MKKKNRNEIVIWVVFIVFAMIVYGAIGYCFYRDYQNRIEVAFQEEVEAINREYAIKELSEIRGRIKTIEYISQSYASNTEEMQEELHEQLIDIVEFANMEHPYFEDFEIKITGSEIGDICEEIISQIDEKLHTIMLEEEPEDE